MKRISLLLVVGALASLTAAQDLTQKVTIDIPAARVGTVLEKLGKATGVRLLVASNLGNEVFVVSVKDVTLNELMQKIARAEGGSWTKQGDGFILGLDPGTAVQQERKEVQARAKFIGAALAKLKARIDQQPVWSDATARKLAEDNRRVMENALNQAQAGGRVNLDGGNLERTPSTRAIARIVSTIDPVALASIKPGQRMVFSTAPTRVQYALANGATQAFRTFVSEQSQYTEAYRASEPASDGSSRMVMINGLGTPSMGQGDPRLGLGIGLIIVNRRIGNTLDFQVIAADPKGETLASGSYFLPLELATMEDSKSTAEEPLKISAEASEMAQFLSGSNGAGGGNVMMVARSSGSGSFSAELSPGSGSGKKVSDALRAKVLQPEVYDPLSFAPGEAFISLSKQTGKNIVALVPDSSFGSITRQLAAGKVGPTSFVASLSTEHGFDLVEEGTWLVALPVDLSRARRTRVDRTALATMLRELDKRSYLSLESLASYAVATPRAPRQMDFDYAYCRMVNEPSANSDFAALTSDNFAMYRLYGSMNASQRQALWDGKPISIGSLTPNQAEMLAETVYHSNAGPVVKQPENPAQEVAGAERTMTIATAIGSGGPIAVFGAWRQKRANNRAA